MDDWDVLTEATIDAIRIESTKQEIRIDVTCRWEGEKRRQIVAQGVDDFVVDDMRLLNIIDRAARLDASGGQETETARRLFFMMRGREPDTSDLQWPVLQEKLDRIRTGALFFMELEPVYGATVLVLAERVQLLAIEG
ncbi:hypothetical protein [Amantichitinum ursilacus]|uniref:Uncharacterized protein n=1 Tax=Amantichitinum ursilacus TaxID=857265 RepID=A0A0N0XLZ0_9NEIS|nr:hypothetical protein [Amantichitinum ursilacus]KPC54578.1 hypothetical protein WG78_03365 [Amantichitinum ursilacus]